MKLVTRMLQIIYTMDESGDNEVANIYERALKGDKSALGNLEKLKNSPHKKSQKVNENAPVRQSEAEKISQDLSKASKSQNFRKYLREKVAEFGAGNQPSKKQIVRNQKLPEKKQFAQSKPFSKVRKRSEQKNIELPDQPNLNPSPNRSEKPSLQPKVKTTSNNFQSNINKNIIKDSATEKDKHSTPPSSKHSFRIRAQGGSKKLLQQLMRLNEQQKRLQSQILHLHKDHKDEIAEVCHKHKIHQLDSNYVKISDNLVDDHPGDIDSPAKNFLKEIKSSSLATQQSKIARLNREIAALTKQIEGKKSEIAKKEARIQVLPLYTYINSVPDIFEERESEQENEEVAELPAEHRKNLDPNKTYQSVMVEMRKKKWGLNQRINYESETSRIADNRQQLPRSPPKGIGFSPAKVDAGDDDKVVVNSRLKQFLFQ